MANEKSGRNGSKGRLNNPYLGFFSEDPDGLVHASLSLNDAAFTTAPFVSAAVSAERIEAAAKMERRAAELARRPAPPKGNANTNRPVRG